MTHPAHQCTASQQWCCATSSPQDSQSLPPGTPGPGCSYRADYPITPTPSSLTGSHTHKILLGPGLTHYQEMPVPGTHCPSTQTPWDQAPVCHSAGTSLRTLGPWPRSPAGQPQLQGNLNPSVSFPGTQPHQPAGRMHFRTLQVAQPAVSGTGPTCHQVKNRPGSQSLITNPDPNFSNQWAKALQKVALWPNLATRHQ